MGELVGAITVIFLFSRLFSWLMTKFGVATSQDIYGLKRTLPYLLSGVLGITLGSFSFGLEYALLLYGLAASICLISDVAIFFWKRRKISLTNHLEGMTVETRLSQLDDLRAKKLISDSEYEMKRDQIISKI